MTDGQCRKSLQIRFALHVTDEEFVLQFILDTVTFDKQRYHTCLDTIIMVLLNLFFVPGGNTSCLLRLS